MNFCCSSLCKDLSDNLTETTIVKNSIVFIIFESGIERMEVVNSGSNHTLWFCEIFPSDAIKYMEIRVPKRETINKKCKKYRNLVVHKMYLFVPGQSVTISSLSMFTSDTAVEFIEKDLCLIDEKNRRKLWICEIKKMCCVV